jgi:hypothetical protein
MGEMQGNGPTVADYANAELRDLLERQGKLERRLADLEKREAANEKLSAAVGAYLADCEKGLAGYDYDHRKAMGEALKGVSGA